MMRPSALFTTAGAAGGGGGGGGAAAAGAGAAAGAAAGAGASSTWSHCKQHESYLNKVVKGFDVYRAFCHMIQAKADAGRDSESLCRGQDKANSLSKNELLFKL
jgi:hypothetical protein